MIDYLYINSDFKFFWKEVVCKLINVYNGNF